MEAEHKVIGKEGVFPKSNDLSSNTGVMIITGLGETKNMWNDKNINLAAQHNSNTTHGHQPQTVEDDLLIQDSLLY